MAGSSTRTLVLVGAAVVVLVLVLATLGEREPATVAGPSADHPTVGDGPVQVFLYEDYQCGHCRDYALGPEYQHLLDAWVEPGNVTLVFKHVAFVGPYSAPAAHASQCVYADAPDAWAGWDHAVYQLQEQRQSPTPALLRGLAEADGVDVDAYDACVADAEARQAVVDANLAEFQQAGATGTPALIVDGQVLNPNDRAAVDAAIQQAVAGA